MHLESAAWFYVGRGFGLLDGQVLGAGWGATIHWTVGQWKLLHKEGRVVVLVLGVWGAHAATAGGCVPVYGSQDSSD